MHFGFLCDRSTQRRTLLCNRRKITCDVQDVLQKDASMYTFTNLAFMKSGKQKAIVWKKTTIHLVCIFHKSCGTCRKYFMINLSKTGSRKPETVFEVHLTYGQSNNGRFTQSVFVFQNGPVVENTFKIFCYVSKWGKNKG